MKNILLGLGNIGDEYAKTRHNIGFIFLDFLYENNTIIQKWKNEKNSLVSQIRIKNKIFILVKPTTYMNLSGNSYKYFANENVIVIYDDKDLEVGNFKYKTKGGSGSHNGIKDIIIKNNNNQKVKRVKIGIGRPKYNLKDYVLDNFKDDELEKIKDIFKDIEEKIMQVVNEK